NKNGSAGDPKGSRSHPSGGASRGEKSVGRTRPWDVPWSGGGLPRGRPPQEPDVRLSTHPARPQSRRGARVLVIPRHAEQVVHDRLPGGRLPPARAGAGDGQRAAAAGAGGLPPGGARRTGRRRRWAWVTSRRG